MRYQRKLVRGGEPKTADTITPIACCKLWLPSSTWSPKVKQSLKVPTLKHYHITMPYHCCECRTAAELDHLPLIVLLAWEARST